MSGTDAHDPSEKNAMSETGAVVVNATDAEAMALASGVMETIVKLALSEVDGVSSLGAPKKRRGLFGAKPQTAPVEVTMEEDGALVALHLTVRYGQVLPDVAAAVRQAVGEALATQVGVAVKRIDIFIDSISFD